MNTKICNICKIEKLATEEHFYEGSCKDGLASSCIDCHKIYMKNWRARNKDRIRKARKQYYQKHKKEAIQYQQNHKEQMKIYDKKYRQRHSDRIKNKNLKYIYGITLEDKKKIYKNQNNKCKICDNFFDINLLKIDHNHLTNEIRGLLCNKCNAGIGFLQENLKILQNAINYLKEYEKFIGGK